MKSLYIAIFFFCLYAVGCYARCDCDATDNACISRCVVEVNGCVTSCKGNIECYENCIDDKWPSADLSEDPPAFNDVLEQNTTSDIGIASAVTSSVVSTATNINSDIASSISASMSASISVKQAEASHVSLGSALTLTGSLPILFICLMSFVIAF